MAGLARASSLDLPSGSTTYFSQTLLLGDRGVAQVASCRDNRPHAARTSLKWRSRQLFNLHAVLAARQQQRLESPSDGVKFSTVASRESHRPVAWWYPGWS